MDENCLHPPKYTVEQIILLQKLVKSGLSKHQIIAGVEEMQKLGVTSKIDNGSRPVSFFNNSLNGPSSNNRSVKEEKANSEQNRAQSPNQSSASSSVFPQALTQPNSLVYQASLRNHPNLLQIAAGGWGNQQLANTLFQNNFNNTFSKSFMQNQAASMLRRSSDGIAAPLHNSSNGGQQSGEEQQQYSSDIHDELDELFRQDPQQVKDEIRKFISERHISQSAIAKATRNAISQSYISQWLAQPQDISGQKKKTMYSWYLAEKRKYSSGGGISGSQHQPLLFSRMGACSVTDQESAQDHPTGQHVVKTKRGSRFTWPKECVSVLEGFYNTNNYPDETKREEIALACNQIIQSHKPGLSMSETEKVTAGKVYNWFANRRKDDKRKRNIEQADSNMEQGSNSLTSPSPRRVCTSSPTYSLHSNESLSMAAQQTNGSSHHDIQQSLSRASAFSAIAAGGKYVSSAADIEKDLNRVNSSIMAIVNAHNEHKSEQMDHDQEQFRSQDGRSSANQELAKDLTTSNGSASTIHRFANWASANSAQPDFKTHQQISSSS